MKINMYVFILPYKYCTYKHFILEFYLYKKKLHSAPLKVIIPSISYIDIIDLGVKVSHDVCYSTQ